MKQSLLLLAGVCLLASQAAAQGAGADEGIAQYRTGKVAQAESTLRAVVEKNGADARAKYFLVLVLTERGNTGEGQTVLDGLQASAADSEWTKLAAARMAIQNKDFDKAESALNEAPDGGDKLFLKGMLQLARKDYKAAAESLEAAIEKQPENAYAHYYAGIAYNGLKRQDKMVEHFEHFARRAPDAPENAKVQSVLRAVRR
jgi:tetratricopeptide (TPR) repeat protein